LPAQATHADIVKLGSTSKREDWSELIERGNVRMGGKAVDGCVKEEGGFRPLQQH
jgi:hypothetical protein